MNDPRDALARREFLRRLAPVLPAAALAACGWDGGKALQPVFDKVIGFNNVLGEKLLAIRGATAPPHQVQAGSMPSYFIADSMPVLDDPVAWRLQVGGRVRRPASLTLPMLAQLPHISYTVTHHCVEGWSVVKSWSGVPFATIAAMVDPLPDARFVRFDSFDDEYYNGWDMASAMHPQTILADQFEGEPLRPDHGAPLRLYSTIKLGYKMTKYLTKITFTNDKPGGYWEDQGYPWFAGL
jgi:DMSO/TMAO reductase YedYZ molybdopterin-dependent catalytic subunit